ncbi:IclR family transcriptional regulator [Nocardioides massiliensis]|uniref:DNA-binding IclR family transcriptional regulator n=1 Tax=Nocardioides massiliensis TaxID=1325935 RepID=A0ABT9NN18_9ACTN|nr:IclR family transcriptional regulator [Nocardioides massiliensis]MDP9821827.1 DNA-binding IclR family transcriptional regulator [Nocardioides massiliensis]
MTRNTPSRDQANMLEKCLRILQAYRSGDMHLRLADLAQRTGMPKSTVHRLAHVLIEHRLLSHDEQGYQLGIALFELSSLVPVEQQLRLAALPFLQDLFMATHETVHLGVREGVDVVYVEKIHGHSDLGLPSRVGGRLPLNCTGIGKALLAFSSDEVRADYLARPLRRITDKSVTDPARLSRELSEVRATGLAFEREEATIGRECVAAPVLVQGEVVAAMSISVPVSAYRMPHLAAAVKTSALGLSRYLRNAQEVLENGTRSVSREADSPRGERVVTMRMT